jgi:hypothetical protein
MGLYMYEANLDQFWQLKSKPHKCTESHSSIKEALDYSISDRMLFAVGLKLNLYYLK